MIKKPIGKLARKIKKDFNIYEIQIRWNSASCHLFLPRGLGLCSNFCKLCYLGEPSTMRTPDTSIFLFCCPIYKYLKESMQNSKPFQVPLSITSQGDASVNFALTDPLLSRTWFPLFRKKKASKILKSLISLSWI